jgi:hypothetical protein
LDSLGFPWILSSESRLFNGLRGLKRRKVLAHAFSMVLEAPQRAPVLLACGSAGLFMGQAYLSF